MEITLSNCLKKEYEIRNERNKLYSLRSFARDLSLSSGRLSDIINKNAAVSEKTLLFLADKLSLEQSIFDEINLQEFRKRKNLAKFEIIEFGEEIQITAVHMAILANVPDHYITIKELFLNDCKDRLLIENSVYDLCDMGLLEIEQGESNIFVRNTTTDTGRVLFNDEKSRKLYFEDCFKRSLETIRTVESEKRIHSASIFMLNEDEIAELQTHFREFRAKILQVINSKESEVRSTDKVHIMALSLSPLFND